MSMCGSSLGRIGALWVSNRKNRLHIELQFQKYLTLSSFRHFFCLCSSSFFTPSFRFSCSLTEDLSDSPEIRGD